jgi:hypothetical protein
VLNIRFSFVTAGAKEKLGKRKRRGLFRLCGGDQRSARWIGGRFLKKATQKLLIKCTPFYLSHVTKSPSEIQLELY